MELNPDVGQASAPAKRGPLRFALLRSTGGILLATILLFVFGGVVAPQSLDSAALSGMFPFAAVLAIVALGQTLVIQQGGIDLSVPGAISLSGVMVSYFGNGSVPGNSTLGFALILAFLAAVASGLINGLLVSRIRVAPIVATIGMNALLYGFVLKISGGTPVAVPASLAGFANGKVFGLSNLVYLAFAVAAAAVIVVKKTTFGRTFEAVGANARAAGVVANRYTLLAYAAASCLYCLGGVLLAGLMTLPSPFQGDSYLMPSIASVVIGGTSPFGGVGNLAASAIAALFLTQLQQLVLTTGSSIGVQYLFQGAVIVIGVGIYSVNWKTIAAFFAIFTAKTQPVPMGPS
jgi:ribose transport system permease protein